MNVIAADMCTNARRVRKRWLPKIQSLLPDSLPASASSHPRRAKRGGAGAGQGAEGGMQPSTSPFEPDVRQLGSSYLGPEAPPCGERGDREKAAAPATPLPHLQFAGSRAVGGGQSEEADRGGRLQTEEPPDPPLSLSSSSSSSSSSHPSPQPTEPAPPHRALAETEERGAEPLEHGQ